MTFSAFVDAFHQHRTQDPNARVQLGLSEGLDELPDPSRAAADRRAHSARRLLGSLDDLAREPLAFDDALDLDLARLLLDAELFDLSYEFNGQTPLHQQPRAGDDSGDGIFLLSVSDPRPAEQRLRDITRRIEGIPAYLDALIARLEHPVARWAQVDAAKVRELPTLLGSIESW